MCLFFIPMAQLWADSLFCYEYTFRAACGCCSVLWKCVAVGDMCLWVYSDWIVCDGNRAEVQRLLCVCNGASSIRGWVTWKGDELEKHAWTSKHDACCKYSDRVAYNLGRCVDCKDMCICRTANILHLEWLRACNFVISSYFLVSFEQIKEL